MNKTILIGLIGGVLAASPAAARCPEAGDLIAGIRIGYLGEMAEIYRAGPDYTVIVDGYTNGVLDRRLSLLHGVYLARYSAVHSDPEAAEADDAGVEVEDSASVYTFPTGANALLAPKPGARWQGEVTVTEGGDARLEGQVH